MTLELATVVELVIGTSFVTFIVGYTVGKLGVAGIENDIKTIKALLSGQQKIIVAPISTADTISTRA